MSAITDHAQFMIPGIMLARLGTVVETRPIFQVVLKWNWPDLLILDVLERNWGFRSLNSLEGPHSNRGITIGLTR